MICYMHHNGCVKLDIKGGIDDVIAETGYMILIIYKELLKKNGCAAEVYRNYFENYSKDFFDCDAAHNKGTEDIESCEKALNDLLNALESIKKNRKKGGDENA